jgi:hypothetical protein
MGKNWATGMMFGTYTSRVNVFRKNLQGDGKEAE